MSCVIVKSLIKWQGIRQVPLINLSSIPTQLDHLHPELNEFITYDVSDNYCLLWRISDKYGNQLSIPIIICNVRQIKE